MPEPSKAVFLSYASQDAEAARCICAALRSAGIEVWFDQSELRGGDAWDAAIRRQIKTCDLFIPVISANTHSREEGYFRLEWKLAVDRSHLMAGTKAFLLPVVIDDTRDDDERTPEKFREVQWTRLAGGDTPPAFVERVSGLLSPDASAASEHAAQAAGAHPRSAATLMRPTGNAAPLWRSRAAVLLMMAVTVIAIGYIAVDQFMLPKHVADSSRTLVPTGAPATPSQSAIPEKSIAVLPFVDMSEKHDQEYFSDGLTEEMIDLLAQVPDLHVPARTSSFYFKGKQVTIAEIARALGVAHVLEGSVRRFGDNIRVTAQLIRVDSGYHVWSQTYDRQMKDVFKVQDEISSAVVAALKSKLPTTQVSSDQRRPKNTEAYTQFLLGREFMRRGTADSTHRAVEAFRTAIALDPNYALAYAKLANAESDLAETRNDPAELRAMAAAEKAVALAPDLSDAYMARGARRLELLDWAGAQADLEKAVALDARSNNEYAMLLGALGRLPEAIEARKKALEVNPLGASVWNNYGYDLLSARQFKAAHRALDRALELAPQSDQVHFNLGMLSLFEAQGPVALKEFTQLGDEILKLTGVAMAEYTLNNEKRSQQALAELIAKGAQGYAFQIAEVFGWRGEQAKSLDWLEHAYQTGDVGLSSLKGDPLLASLRGDPRYKALLRKMNLPE